MHPAMFPYLPEHLASRYVILYACVTMVLDSNGPTFIIKLVVIKDDESAFDAVTLIQIS